MKNIKLLLFFILLVIAQAAHAQWRPTGNLNVFSEDGDRFYLILNGERYNDVPQTNVRIEELPNPYYSCKIIFENSRIPSISKNNLMVADVNGQFQDVSYRIKKDRKGRNVLRFYSNIPIQQNMIRPTNCVTYRYGVPNVIISGPGFDAQINMRNRNRYQPDEYTYDPDEYTYRRETYRTDPYQNYPQDRYHQHDDRHHNRPQNNPYGGCRMVMNSADFAAALNTIGSSSFDQTKLSTAKQIVSSNCMSSSQITQVMNQFGFESSKLDFAKYAYSFCADPNNYFKVNNAFGFESSKTALNQYIQNLR